jgi:hypothetical protein
MSNVVMPKPFVCHGEVKGLQCPTKLAQADAWLPETGTIRQVTGSWPAVSDLADHTYCGRCASLGRKAGLRFHRYQQTVVWMERKRVERLNAARQVFRRYLPKVVRNEHSAGATPAAKPA